MTKKLSILSIVVVLLFSLCLVGCGDSSGAANKSGTESKSGNDSIAIEDYSKEIVGTWKAVDGELKYGKYRDAANDKNATGGYQKFDDVNYIISFHSDSTFTVEYTTSDDSDMKGKHYEIKGSTIQYGSSISEIHHGKAYSVTIKKMTKYELELELPDNSIFLPGTIRFAKQ
ncbi:MAG: hypothetical protein ILA24_05405 [Ruminococcus sp.]|nr:hypothetical protein [Ruminococcus sp.]